METKTKQRLFFRQKSPSKTLRRSILPTMLLFTLISVISLPDLSAQSFGNGNISTLSVSGTNVTIDQNRAAVKEINFWSSTVDIKLDPAHFYSSGTAWSNTSNEYKALVIIMAQDGSSLPTRNWQIMSYSSSDWNNTTKTLTLPWFPHTNWPSGVLSPANCKMQVVLVPQINNATINSTGVLTCTPWDGYTGGVLAFLVKNTLTVNNGGWISVAEKGFSNSNTGGFGGNGGAGGNAPSPQPPVSAADAFNGDAFEFDVRPPGQPITPLPNLSGGNGGTGGLKVKADWGWPGGDRGTRLNLPAPQPPKLLVLGNAGAQGRGGRGGDGGGSGGNGGNGAMPLGVGTTGQAGISGGTGGNGGNGGSGGGLIIILANQIVLPTSSQCIDISGANGSIGGNATGIGGQAGDGGNGGDGGCDNNLHYVGYGGLGIRGQRGNGPSGGSGGGGGSIGSFSIRCHSNYSNPLSKSVHVKYQKGIGMPGGIGGPAYNIPAIDGIDGYLNDPTICPPYNAISGIRRVHTIYNCAALEAYQVLADMDVAIDKGYFIEYRKSNGTGTCKKAPYDKFAMQDTDYYCLYFKCSKLIMAFEPTGKKPVQIMRTNPTNGYTGVAYQEEEHNIYWCKLDDPGAPPMAKCIDVHKDLFLDINASLVPLPTSTSILATASFGITPRSYDFGYVDYGSSVGGIHKYRYYDIPTYTQLGNGSVGYKAAGSYGCQKACVDTLFKWDWVRFATCYVPSAVSGGQGELLPDVTVENPGYPRIPYDPALWDNPDDGKQGDPGDDGEEDDSYFEGGETIGGGDIESESSKSTGINKITNVGNYAMLTPNPAHDQLLVTFDGKQTSNTVSIKVMDVMGKVVLQQQVLVNSNHQEVINIQQLAPGTYFVKLIANNYTEMLKFVKH